MNPHETARAQALRECQQLLTQLDALLTYLGDSARTSYGQNAAKSVRNKLKNVQAAFTYEYGDRK